MTDHPAQGSPGGDAVTVFLGGDVMTGRGIDQIMAHPGDPTLFEPVVRHAARYVTLAEQTNGPIPRVVPPDYIWGDLLAHIRGDAVHARIVNLETAVTDRGNPWPGKGIHYRMHPGNRECLSAAGIDCVTMANNHVLDWGDQGLEQTVDTLSSMGLAVVGAGPNRATAWAPAVLDGEGTHRVVVVGFGLPSSGIPDAWAAGSDRPGVALVRRLADAAVDEVAAEVSSVAQPGDLVIASIHWGGNWGYGIPSGHRWFAHRLIDRAGVHMVHGHSSHHPLGIEVYRERPILYGCGDLITDYEGIGGHDEYRSHLGLMYLVTMSPATGRLRRLDLVPTTMRRFQLQRASPADTRWLAELLNGEGGPLGTRVELIDDSRLTLVWAEH